MNWRKLFMIRTTRLSPLIKRVIYLTGKSKDEAYAAICACFIGAKHDRPSVHLSNERIKEKLREGGYL